MKSYSSKEVIKILESHGWKQEKNSTRGSHTKFSHDKLPGKITVPHPKKDLPIGTVKSIFKQAGIKFI